MLTKGEMDALSACCAKYLEYLGYNGMQLPHAVAINLGHALQKMKDVVENKSPIVVLT